MKRIAGNVSIADFVNGKLPPEESLAFLERIERDPKLSAQLEAANLLANAADAYGEAFLPSKVKVAGIHLPFLPAWLVSRKVAYGFLALAVCLFTLIGLFTVRWSISLRYASLTRLDPIEIEASTRGAAANEFERAGQLYGQGRVDDAIEVFERFIRAYPHDDALDYAHFSAGSLYLLSSRREFLSLVTAFDRERVLLGIQHLRAADQMSERTGLRESTQFMLAKASLMLGDSGAAIMQLGRVMSIHGRREKEAQVMLEELQEVR